MKVHLFAIKKHDKQYAGHMLINGEENGFVRLANILNLPIELSGRELIFAAKKE